MTRSRRPTWRTLGSRTTSARTPTARTPGVRTPSVPALVGALALVGGFLTVAPAVASADSRPSAPTLTSRVTGVEPPVEGLDVSVDAAGDLVLVNETGGTVVVRGYAGEEYLRVTAQTVEENTASLTSTLDPSRQEEGTAPDVPSALAPDSPAQWTPVSDGPRATWSDLRTRWTSPELPPNVLADPASPHQVFEWAVPVEVDGRPVLVRGDLRSDPQVSDLGTNRTLWAVGAVAAVPLAVGAVAARRTVVRRRTP